MITLSGNNILQFDSVLEKPLEECLLFLAYQSDWAQLQNIMMRENSKSNT